MRIRFYLDEHVSGAVAAALRRRGVDVQMVAEAGMRGATDGEQLSLATQASRVLFTHDVDFLRLHAAGTKHAGIVYSPQGKSVGRILEGLMLIYQLLTPDNMANHVEYI